MTTTDRPTASALGNAHRRAAQRSIAPGRVPRIAVIAQKIVRGDAISRAALDTWSLLAQNPGWAASILTETNEIDDLPARIVNGVSDLLLAPEFLSADLLIYHFGFRSSLYDALLMGNGRARQAVFFHGFTPPELRPAEREELEQTKLQVNNFRHADRIWPVSSTNADFLAAMGFGGNTVEIIPLPIGRPAISRLTDKDAAPVGVAFLGKIVPHKGLVDLVAAISRVRRRNPPPFRIRVAANLEAVDRSYYELVWQAITAEQMDDIVAFVGELDEEPRDRLLKASHILAAPSYHEGFCKPVIEGLRAGCVPVGYASYHLRYTADGLCRMVAPGDVAALAEALYGAIVDTVAAISDPTAHIRLDRGALTAVEFAAAASAHVEQFDPERVRPLLWRKVSELLAAG